MYEQLIALGLTRTEARIYGTLVDLGRAQAGIISRRTGIHRRSVYDALDRLIEKGLVSYIKENDKRYYTPADPARFKEMISHMSQGIESIMPSLQAKYNEVKTRQETLFFRGKEGMRTIFEDQLADKKDVYIIATPNLATEGLKYYLPHYETQRIKKKMKLHILYAGGILGLEIPLAEIRHLPTTFASPVSTNIYGEKVAILIWSMEPVAILIKNKDVALTYKKYFDALWEIGKKR